MSEFTPPECPNPVCTSSPFRYRWRGYYRRACDGRRVPRFECLGCRRRYSSQTFRNDYRHRRPELNIPIVLALDSKVTQRQIARTHKCNLKSVARRSRLFGVHFRDAHSRVLAGLKLEGPLVFDELETYEQNRIEKPVTMCVVVDKDTGFIVHGELGTLPSRDKKRGDPQRKSQSRAAVKRCMQVVAEHRDPDCVLHLISDCKVTYPTIVSELVGGSVLHTRIPGKAKRNTSNPLFPINHLFAMLRDGVSRLVRRTWAYSKKIECLEDHFWIYLGFKNYIRPRTNLDRRPSAASKVGAVPRRYDIAEAVAWRGRFSLH